MTPPVTEMVYPITTPDGTVVDIALPRDGLDPFYDECPAWCMNAATGHRHVEVCDADRMHYGTEVDVPLRAVTADWGGETIILATARMYLQRNVRDREPMIWLGEGESNGGFLLTASEAEAIGRALLDLVAATR